MPFCFSSGMVLCSRQTWVAIARPSYHCTHLSFTHATVGLGRKKIHTHTRTTGHGRSISWLTLSVSLLHYYCATEQAELTQTGLPCGKFAGGMGVIYISVTWLRDRRSLEAVARHFKPPLRLAAACYLLWQRLGTQRRRVVHYLPQAHRLLTACRQRQHTHDVS